jgi:hypothetical protein
MLAKDFVTNEKKTRGPSIQVNLSIAFAVFIIEINYQIHEF